LPEIGCGKEDHENAAGYEHHRLQLADAGYKGFRQYQQW
jgi:hypothetical protein